MPQWNHFPMSAYALASNHAPGNAPLTAVQLLWVNMIMDTLGALALATEPPNDDLMKRTPVGRKGNFISNVMWRNILGQSLYQFVVIWLLQTRGKSVFRLDGPDSDLILNTLIFNSFVFCQVTFLKDLQALLVEHYVWSGIMWYILNGRWWQAGLVFNSWILCGADANVCRGRLCLNKNSYLLRRTKGANTIPIINNYVKVEMDQDPL